MASINHSNNLSFVTLPTPSSTSPPSSTASNSSPSSTGWTEKITKKIEELNKQLDDLNNLKNAQSGYLAEQYSKSLDSLPTQLTSLETVHKLAEFAEQLDTNKNASNNILTNLCTGLEKFLGFNSTSKGYNGSGIVYSDLDRLCDGVMGFLSGVLGAVKDEDAVTTYDKYIMPETNRLEKVLEKLTSSIGSGRTGLAASVGAVREWLEEYNDDVTKLTSAVTSKLGKLTDKLSSSTGEYYKRVYEHTDLSAQLTMWTTTLGQITADIRNIETDDINKLDSALKKCVMHEMKQMQKSVQVLIEAARNGELVKQADKVDWTLVKQKENIERTLREEFRDINSMVDTMQKTKKRHFHHIYKSFDSAQDFLNDKFDEHYTTNVKKYFDIIRNRVDRIHTELTTEKNRLEEWVSNIQMYFTEIKTEVKGKDGSGKTNGLMKHWQELKTFIKGYLDLISDENKKSGALDLIVKGVATFADKFKKNGDMENGFDKQVGEWIANILRENGIIKVWLDKYFTHNKSVNGKSNFSADITDVSSLHSHIIKGIKDALGTEINGAGAKVSTHIQDANDEANSNRKIEKYFEAVKEGCNEFAKELGSRLGKKVTDQGKINEVVEQITNNIGKHVKKLDATNYGSHTLNGVVEGTLAVLASTVGQVSAEFQKFKTTAQIANVETAMKRVCYIKQQIDDNHDQNINGTTNDYGKLIDETLHKVKEQIEAFDIYIKPSKDGKIDLKIKEIGKHLEQLNGIKMDNGIIDLHKKESETKMKDLKNAVQNHISTTRLAVAKAEHALENSIKSLIMTVNVASQNAENAVSSAFATLSSEVRSLFADAHKADLAALKTLVEEQKAEIERIIQHDKHNGLKGLLIDKIKEETHSKLDEFIRIAGTPITRGPLHSQLFTEMLEKLKWYSKSILDYIRLQVRTPPKVPGQESEPSEVSIKVGSIRLSLDRLLDHLEKDKLYNYDHDFVDLLTSLTSLVSSLSPSFTSPSPLLAPLKAGLSKFTAQLGHVYVNRYSGEKFTRLTERKQVPNPEKPESKDKIDVEVLTTEGRNCAKVCLTIVEILGHDLGELRKICSSLKKFKRIYASSRSDENLLGKFFSSCGYQVASEKDKQDGEIRNSSGASNTTISIMLNHPCKLFISGNHENNAGKLKDLVDHLHHYYEVCHYATLNANKHPSSIYEMLQWFAAFPNNPVHLELTTDGFEGLFEKRKADTKEIEDDGVTLDLGTKRLETYRETITPEILLDAFTDVCAQSHSVLTAVLGHGHAGGRYAVDFNTNEDKFTYPSDMNALICMMLEIAKRLHDQLFFLYRQCSDGPELSGWEDCWYGQEIGGSSWKCNVIQCPEQGADQKHNQTCDQKCNQTANCGIKSPLQSFLEDGLSGFLPHQLKFEKGKLECTLGNHAGGACKTPLGFGDISYIASHRQQGKHLKEVLFDFCSEEWCALSRLCSLLSCLLPSAPKTLEDMFGFYNTFLSGWNNMLKRDFVNAVNDANFKRTDATLEIKPLFNESDHAQSNNMPHLKGDLYSLVNCNYNSTAHPAYPCAPYLRPITYYRCGVYSKKHAGKYVSWFVYVTETFLNLLEQMYNDCCENCGSSTSKCRVSKCVDGCEAKAKPDALVSIHNETCNSIVHCGLMRPTLFRYGFVFRNTSSLSGVKTVQTKRTCKDFCDALGKVINKEEKFQRALAELVYRTISNFLFAIRAPFIWTTLALWLLSLLYLLHIMVIRLDLLHIKSHLHSPSSHRIAAQSLLAAARVNKLGRVFYLQP